MLKRMSLFFALLGLAAMAFVQAEPPEARVLRFPTISADTIVFSSAGDLYSVPAAGGVARKITSHPGYEIFARFSPDGKTLAFTAEYDGTRDIYVMPAEGGIPRRVTYTSTLGRDDLSDRMGPNNIVMGWKHDNKHIVFRSRMREWDDFIGQLYLASVEAGTFANLPLPRGGFCSFSPDDSKLAYNRIFREFRTWKRYRGGMADDVWIYDFGTKKIENITNNPALDIIPMWSGDTVYFLSDRDESKRLNLFAYDLKTKQTRQLTHFVDYDIKFPSLGPAAIVFENGGFIYRFDLAGGGQAVKVPIFIVDDQLSGRTKLANVSSRVSNYEIAPDGKRALFGARGEIFTVPAQYGNVRNLTNTPGVHERDSKWSPDGKWIAYISDASGEDEIYIRPQDGSGTPVQLTTKADTYKYGFLWSPDGKKILWSDKLFRLQYVDVESKQVVVVDQAKIGEMGPFSWSPDSRWVAYTKPEVDVMPKVLLYDLAAKKSHEVTDGWYASYSPVFSGDGKYLFFVSDRDFNPTLSAVELSYAYSAMSRIYFATLAADTKSPFAPKSDEVEIKKTAETAPAKPGEKAKPAEPKKEEKPAAGVTVKVDPEGIKSRLVGLPIEVSNYGALGSVGDKVYYLKFNPDGGGTPAFKSYSLSDQKETDLGQINGYEISADQKKMLVLKDNAYGIIDLPAGPVRVETRLDLSGMDMTLDLKKEWEQIFLECWRQMKYFFYAPNMHGVDWEAMKQKYRPLAKAVNSRADLTYVIGEMIGELSSGHTYVGGGDLPVVPKVKVGQLGAEVVKDASGFFKVAKIFRGQNWDNTLRSPLTEIGVDVRDGDYILAVNGQPTSGLVDLYEALVNTVGKQVTLKINAKPEDKGSREVVVVPISDEQSLVYYTWVQENIAKVSKATNGKVGYVHIPDMGFKGLNEFVKYYYPQLRKKALIVDVRGNGGGFVSPMIIERLRREIVMVEMARDSVPRPDPNDVLVGPKVCLMNEFSASDGDIFPYRFRAMGLGKLIGKRTWGGVVGIRGTLPLLDGGFLNKPEFAPYNLKDQWIMEGIGVEPDIEVDNDPAEEYAGNDQQLNKAIEVILEELKTKEFNLPPIPPFPIKK